MCVCVNLKIRSSKLNNIVIPEDLLKLVKFNFIVFNYNRTFFFYKLYSSTQKVANEFVYWTYLKVIELSIFIQCLCVKISNLKSNWNEKKHTHTQFPYTKCKVRFELFKYTRYFIVDFVVYFIEKKCSKIHMLDALKKTCVLNISKKKNNLFEFSFLLSHLCSRTWYEIYKWCIYYCMHRI